ncbi:hypothetical protein CR513_28156, partial [Mucuna pruriens]
MENESLISIVSNKVELFSFEDIESSIVEQESLIKHLQQYATMVEVDSSVASSTWIILFKNTSVLV